MVFLRSSLKCSIEDHVDNRELPEGGLQALQETVLKDLAWAGGLPTHFVDAITYRRQLSILISGMYVLAPQGRIEAFTTLTLPIAQQQLLSDSGCALSNTFKTYDKYGYQPISLPKDMRHALQVYALLRASFHTTSDVFFIDHEGHTFDSTKLGHLVTQYFKTTMSLHITTTMIRSLWEIMADKALKADVINSEQRSAILNINGHSSQTTKDYYLRAAREQDALHGEEVREAIIRHDVQLINVDCQRTLTTKFAWGTEHPCYGLSASRVQWSDFEKRFVIEWCDRALLANPELKYKIVRMCLDHIKSQPSLVAQFHEHHTLDSSRLGYPWKTIKKQDRLSAGPDRFACI